MGTHAGYDAVYRGRWHYNYTGLRARVREWAKLKFHIVRHFGIAKGSRVLEVACGQGQHVALMDRLGMRTTGVDVSIEADVRWVPARRFVPLVGPRMRDGLAICGAHAASRE